MKYLYETGSPSPLTVVNILSQRIDFSFAPKLEAFASQLNQTITGFPRT